MFKRKKKKPTRLMARYETCIWCKQSFDVNGHDWVCDGNGENLHTKCFEERWGIAKRQNNENR